MVQHDSSPLREIRRLEELYGLMAGYDGLGEFGANLFPYKTPVGRYECPAAGAGTGWVGKSTAALLYPGPDGPVATERFEMFREGVELCEAVIYIRHAQAAAKLTEALQTRIEDYLHMPAMRLVNFGLSSGQFKLNENEPEGKRLTAINRGFFVARFLQSEEDAKLLDLADEVAWELEGKK